LRTEYKAIVDAGFLLQLDCPDLARERHNTFADRPIDDFLTFGNRVVDAINEAIRDIPPERVRLHVCWGNYEGPHDLDVELQEIIPFLRRAKVGGFVLPFANPRHAHEYRYLKDLIAQDQIIVAGVIDSTTNFVEHPEVIAERLENVAKTVGDPHRVMAGSDCGFETIAGRGRVAEMWCGRNSSRWRRAPSSPRRGCFRRGSQGTKSKTTRPRKAGTQGQGTGYPLSRA